MKNCIFSFFFDTFFSIGDFYAPPTTRKREKRERKKEREKERKKERKKEREREREREDGYVFCDGSRRDVAAKQKRERKEPSKRRT